MGNFTSNNRLKSKEKDEKNEKDIQYEEELSYINKFDNIRSNYFYHSIHNYFKKHPHLVDRIETKRVIEKCNEALIELYKIQEYFELNKKEIIGDEKRQYLVIDKVYDYIKVIEHDHKKYTNHLNKKLEDLHKHPRYNKIFKNSS